MKSRKNFVAEVSMFPFMNILICTMGALSFIMVSLASMSAVSPSVDVEIENPSRRSTSHAIPRFVECHADHMLVHPERESIPVVNMGEADSEFMQIVRQVRDTKNHYIIFGVYPSGIECFYEGRDIVTNNNVPIGYEPMIKGWVVDFPLQDSAQ